MQLWVPVDKGNYSDNRGTDTFHIQFKLQSTHIFNQKGAECIMKKQPFHFALYLLICLLVPLAATAQTVDIPDANLRAKIENALGKASGDAITVTDMETLTRLSAKGANISDLTGLEFAIKLIRLNLGPEFEQGRPTNSNSVSDISPLAALTNLTELRLDHNQVSDISPLAALTNLTQLFLWNNSISNISPLAGLTNLTELRLDHNQVSDIAPLTALTNLTQLRLRTCLKSTFVGCALRTSL